jgi:hypothetical protein
MDKEKQGQPWPAWRWQMYDDVLRIQILFRVYAHGDEK